MNWLSQMIITPIDLNKQYQCNSDIDEPDDGIRKICEFNKNRGLVARKLILDALGNERLSSSQLLAKIKKTNGGAFKRMMKILVEEGVISTEVIGKRAFWWRVK